VASLDIERAYHNSPIIPHHKPYLSISWNGSIYVRHVAVEGLTTAGGIQGNTTDALLDILWHHRILHIFKWVDDVIIFRSLVCSFINVDSMPEFTYGFGFDLVFDITMPLGVPWHLIESKGQDFTSSIKYIGFLWDLKLHHVSLPEKKCVKIISKIDAFISFPNCVIMRKLCASIHVSLQHISFIYKEGHSTLPPLSSFISKFLNDFT